MTNQTITKEKLESMHGKGNVWTTEELTKEFDVLSFMAPLAVVIRKKDGVKGAVQFLHMPRFYFDFERL